MSNTTPLIERTIWTIGHADHSLEKFLGLLAAQHIQVLVDTRSMLPTDSNIWFHPDNLQASLENASIKFRRFGQDIPKGAEGVPLHEPEGSYKAGPLPCLQFESVAFQGWAKLEQGCRHSRIALLCSEESPVRCNRRLLISRPLTAKGIKTCHIRGNGRLQAEEDLKGEEEAAARLRPPTTAATEIYSIGVTSYAAARFFGTLRQAGIGRLLDVRLNNWTQLAGFTKRDDLPFFLKELCDAEYVHEPLLAPTRTLLDSYKKNGGRWQEYEQEFLALLAERRVEEQLDRRSFDIPTVLLCYEAEADFCHRRLVLKYLQQKWGGLKITHL